MEIIHIVRQFYPCIGGLENFVLNLAQKQISLGHNVTIVTLNKNFFDNSTLPAKDTYDNIKIKRVSFLGSKRYPIAFFCLKYLCGADIIHIHGVDFFVDYLVFTKTFHRKKIILHTHGGFFHTKFMRFLKIVYFNYVTRFILKRCDKIIASSQHDYELFSKITKNIIRIDNGVDIDKWKNITKDIETGMLLYVGRIDVHKRIDNLIKVVDRLLKRGINVKLKVVGPDWKGLQRSLENLISELNIKGKIIFLGKISDQDLRQEFSKAHLFLSASEYEAFGISAVEAMASGTVCVLNHIDSFREFINHEENGFIVDYNNLNDSVSTISRIISMDNKTYQMLACRSQRTAEKYSWDSVSKEITSVYHHL